MTATVTVRSGWHPTLAWSLRVDRRVDNLGDGFYAVTSFVSSTDHDIGVLIVVQH